MAVRLIDIVVPDARVEEAEQVIRRHCRRHWRVDVVGPLEQLSCLVQGRDVEQFLGELAGRFEGEEGFSAVVVPTEALLPPIPDSQATALSPDGEAAPTRLESFFSRDRLSTDELYDDIEPNVEVRPAYLVTVVLSAVIAGLGMRTGNVAVIIGAMVVAPLLGPAIGMALAATVGDRQLLRRAAQALVVGAIVAVAVTFGVGRLVTVDPTAPELVLRTTVKASDVGLALASGAAGVLAFSRGRAMSLVGVMIAVALVPPLSAAGLYLAIDETRLAIGALYLFGTNLVAVNLAGIATFLFQGLPPKDWRMTGGIISVWLVVLLLFLAAVVGSGTVGEAIIGAG